MHGIQSQNVYCPYCGECFEAIIDCSVPEQSYIEDCEVCCSPISFQVLVLPGGTCDIQVSHENE